MSTCYYCQDEVPADKDFVVTAPDKTQTHICAECVGDISKFFKSGEAEEKLLEEIAPEKRLVEPAKLALKGHELCEIENGTVIKTFDNVAVERVSWHALDPYQMDRLRGISSRGISQGDMNSWYGMPVRKVLRFDAVILDAKPY